MVSCPQFYITLKGSQVLASGSIGFGEECKGVVDPGELVSRSCLDFSVGLDR